MTSLLESPWPGAVLGGLLTIMLLAGYLQTGRRALLAGALVALLLGAALVLIELQVETVRERIEAKIHSLAEALEANRDQEILRAIHSLAPEVKTRAQAELDRYEFVEVDVKSNLKIEIDQQHEPPRTEASFNVVARLTQYPRPIPRFVTLVFWREADGVWRVIDYSHASFETGFKKRP